ncbi:beta-lactamase family protein [Flavobacterium supellecticarium]|uniref:Beta-lactamase family protein n=1 Tax=Flavobacterium supellecticarium TaxID=2565924 RepID=A0A4V6RWW6_9FLAO|nr:serine hydrolase domain-containing protein [Flavobacterium supellecticarium]THF53326.1 beta-lactamase family protein [Flavobacterium supellecticarium]
MIKKIAVLLLLSSIFFCSCRKMDRKTTREVVQHYHKEGKLNGAVLIVQNDSMVCDTVLGYADFKSQRPLEKETPFYIASLAKPITAIGIMLLEQKKLLSYDDRVNRYINDLPDYLKEITIRQLLTHTSGVCDYENVLTGTLTNKDVMHWLQNQKLQFVPGMKYQYSNTGYILLALIIEKVSGTSLKTFLEENISHPLKMQHMVVYDETKPDIPAKAIGYTKNKVKDDYTQLTTGDGGIYATTDDLYKLDKALRNGLLLAKHNTEVMYRLPVFPDGKLGPYGLGWFVENKHTGKIVMHTGGLAGFRSLFWRDLKNNTTIIVLTNQGDAFPVYNFLDEIKETLVK